MKSQKPKIAFTSAEPYRVQDGYLFPFILKDPTPSGSNLGRIEWNIELYKTRRIMGQTFFVQLIVWARSTRDPRYESKFFLLRCHTPGIMSSTGMDQYNDFMHCSWMVATCLEHGRTIIAAYPADEHCALHVETHSEFGSYIKFRGKDNPFGRY